MKKISLILALCFVVFSCIENDENEYINENEGIFAYTYSADSQIALEEVDASYMKYTSVVSGSNLVFEYEFQREDVEIIADDEYSEFIRFEIDPNLEEFSYSDSELTAINTFLTQECFCAFYEEDKDVPPTGTISGKKISDTEWDISIDVVFYADQSKTISNKFRLKE